MKKLLFILCILNVLNSFGQYTFKIIKKRNSNTMNFVKLINDTLYTAYKTGNSTFRMVKYKNGIFDTLPECVLSSSVNAPIDFIVDAVVYKGSLHLFLSKMIKEINGDTLPGIADFHVIKKNGNKWHAVNSNNWNIFRTLIRSIRAFVVKDTLFVQSLDGVSAQDPIRINRITNNIGKILLSGYNQNGIFYFVATKNYLLCISTENPVNGLAVYQGDTFKNIINSKKNIRNAISTENDNVIVIDSNNNNFLAGRRINTYNIPSNSISTRTDTAKYGMGAIISNVELGVKKNLLFSIENFNQVFSGYNFANRKSVKLPIFGNTQITSDYYNLFILDTVALKELIDTGLINTVCNVTVDENNSCSKQNNEINYTNRIVYCYNNGIESSDFIDINGNFSLNLLPGKNNIKIYTTDSIKYNCKTDTFSVSKTDTFFRVYIRSATPKNPLKYSLVPKGKVRIQDTVSHYVWAFNSGKKRKDIYFYLNIDSNINVVSVSGATLISNNKGKLQIKIDSMRELEKITFKLNYSAPNNKFKEKDYFRIMLFKAIINSDTTIINDTLSESLPIVSSYDPNLKVSIPQEFIEKNTKEIHYTIYFQNEGTSYAKRVVIEDPISEKIIFNKINVTAASHDYKLSINGRKLIWTFDNINLLPKKDNEDKSKGFVSFVASIPQGLQAGTRIENTAYIYFDYNPPIITNTNILAVPVPVSTQTLFYFNNYFTYFPNPCTNSFHIRAKEKPIYIEVYNINGQKIIAKNIAANVQINIDTKNWTNGMYFIKCNGTTSKILVNK